MHNLSVILREALKRRGTELAPLPSPEEWNNLTLNTPAQVISHVTNIYGDFNGFTHCDHKSQVKFWTIQEILRRSQDIILSILPSSLIIGDIMIESHYIVYDTASSLIEVDGYDEQGFASIFAILEYLAEGHFDVI